MVLSTCQLVILSSCHIKGSDPADTEMRATFAEMDVSLGLIGLFMSRLRKKVLFLQDLAWWELYTNV